MANGKDPLTGEYSDVIKEAKERFKLCQTYEVKARQNFLSDMRFANGDSVNGYQWPDNFRMDRELQQRPCLTINKVRQHNLNITNDAMENKPGIAYRASGNGATFEAAQMWTSIARKIEYQSNAPAVYDLATRFQVGGGVGYWRIVTDYVDANSFDQDAFIRPIADPLTVFIDPDAKEPDKSDMRFAFIFEDMDLAIARKKFGNTFKATTNTLSATGNDWLKHDQVRVAEYYRIVETEDELWLFQGEDGEDQLLHKSLIPKDVKERVGDDPLTRKRPVIKKQVEWKFIIGDEEVDSKLWVGEEIPIIIIVGEETIIDGELDRKGHTRALLDPQRMYNYWSSSAVEFGALQTKTPWIASAEAIEGFQGDWEKANTENKALLLWNALDESGQPIPPPQRVQPPVAAPVAMQGMQTAMQEMMMVSGQYENAMGQQGNERTGKAINERQRQGDKATYHFINNLALGVRRTGKILLDIIPKIYDTKRVIAVLAEDGQSLDVEIDPQAQKAFQQGLDHDNKVAQRVLNPTLGKFDVYADTGPGYATKREEAFNAFTLILTQAPQLASIIGDLLLKAGDFPMADEAAIRLRRMVPPQALGQGPTQNEQQLQQQLQQLQQLYSKAIEKHSNDSLKLKGHSEKRDVDIFNALTKRLQVMVPAMQAQSPEAIKQLITEVMQETKGESMTDDAQAVDSDLAQEHPGISQEMPPIPGARKAPDGEWYLDDPIRKGKYLKVRHSVNPQSMAQGFMGANNTMGMGNGQ